MAKQQLSSSQVQPEEKAGQAVSPAPELAERFLKLEKRIEAIVDLVAKLREENRTLAERLVRAEELRRQAVERLESLLDKVNTLT